VLVVVETSDVVFAVDSIPAILAVSHEQFIVFSSNAFAILGLRALYFLLADLRDRFDYLQQGLAVILTFVGVKMVLTYWDFHIDTFISLGIIAAILTVAIVLSQVKDRKVTAGTAANGAGQLDEAGHPNGDGASAATDPDAEQDPVQSN
jgi:tellurite resistance protein TerC